MESWAECAYEEGGEEDRVEGNWSRRTQGPISAGSAEHELLLVPFEVSSKCRPCRDWRYLGVLAPLLARGSTDRTWDMTLPLAPSPAYITDQFTALQRLLPVKGHRHACIRLRFLSAASHCLWCDKEPRTGNAKWRCYVSVHSLSVQNHLPAQVKHLKPNRNYSKIVDLCSESSEPLVKKTPGSPASGKGRFHIPCSALTPRLTMPDLTKSDATEKALRHGHCR